IAIILRFDRPFQAQYFRQRRGKGEVIRETHLAEVFDFREQGQIVADARLLEYCLLVMARKPQAHVVSRLDSVIDLRVVEELDGLSRRDDVRERRLESFREDGL